VAFKVVIPARYASTRLPGKPLLDIGGRPMILRVVAQALASGAAEVVVATDDERVASAVRDGPERDAVRVVMTDSSLPSGTDRAAVVAERLGWSDDCAVVNLQGDEPFMPPELIRQVAGLLEEDASAGIATLATPVTSVGEFLDPNVVKVVRAPDGGAMYFSRAPIPWSRDGAPGDLASQREFAGALRHVGLYAYRAGALRRLARLVPSALEGLERLEQLRALEAGVRIAVAVCAVPPASGVDTPGDLEKARVRAAAAP
jgi:3-deoxy-manno-octulosonate cytidylyltransferase (CMP-KDO synthetase)